MSVMNFQSSFRDVKPPDKGSFPLDHEGKQFTGIHQGLQFLEGFASFFRLYVYFSRLILQRMMGWWLLYLLTKI